MTYLKTALEHDQVMHDMIKAVRDAALFTRHHLEEHRAGRFNYEVEIKDAAKVGGITQDPVTFFDTRNEQMIFDKLRKLYPDIGTLGEETGAQGFVEEDGAQRWVLDPIDGTKNLKNGSPDFSISLALQKYSAKKQAWVSTRGVIAIPMQDILYHASKGKGAYAVERVYRQEGTSLLRERRLKIDAMETGDYTAHPPRPDQVLGGRCVEICLARCAEPLLQPIFKDIQNIDFGTAKMMNSSAMAFAYVAGGQRQGFVTGGLEEHDNAAGLLIAKEAGAFITEIELNVGDAAKPMHRKLHIVSDEPMLHNALARLTIKACEQQGIAHKRELLLGKTDYATREQRGDLRRRKMNLF